ncbi:MAG: hypothetical protein UT63_C0016G0002 [Candidatus Gottesmanbacteria bacterium GW2011_GWC2_39_8]|uniref:Zinc-ribbon domain-containing protein n=1 Tax=Candidatus Gottesmanbacteria bacterium GW2011_GWC2_39_8 TaxID=1618450 RepID=A0A0G0PZW7_9BACT|nr:MAG: hypothetical protein UT63_C0016G0002 [Candidatus Gottesmanbacteria bacterium GW2011_GWC2_39_8]
MICSKCQANNIPEATLCYKCGNRLKEDVNASSPTPTVFSISSSGNSPPPAEIPETKIEIKEVEPAKSVENTKLVPVSEHEAVKKEPLPTTSLIEQVKPEGIAPYSPFFLAIISALFGAATGSVLLGKNFEFMGEKARSTKIFRLSLVFVVLLNAIILAVPSINYLISGGAIFLFFFLIYRKDYKFWQEKKTENFAKPKFKQTLVLVLKGICLSLLIFFLEGIIFTLVKR